MAAHQAGGDLEVFLFRRLRGLDDPPDRRRIGGERLLHEHVDAFFHGVFQLLRTPARIAGQHGDVAGTQAVDRLAIGVEADEPPLRRHVDLVGILLAQGRVRRGQPFLEQVGHDRQLDRPAGRASKALTAAPLPRPPQPIKRQSDGVVLGGVHVRNGGRGQPATGNQGAASTQKIPA